MKWLKGFFALVLILVLILIGVIAFVVTSIDPNSYKPELEKLAQENGITLAIEGDLGWSFYPDLAVQAGNTSLSGEKDSGIPSVQFQQANFVLDWSALLARTVRLRAIIVDSADIKIESAEEAANVAALPGAAAASQEQSQTTGSTTTELPFELAIDELALNNSRITLVSPGNPDQVLEQLTFTSKGLNLEGKHFLINLGFSTQLPEQTSTVNLVFDSQVALQLDPQQLQLSNAQLKLDGLNIEDKALPTTLAFNAKYNGPDDSVTLTELSGKLGSAVIEGDIKALQVQTKPSASGNFSIANLQLNELPIEAPEGFKTLSVRTQFSASETAVALEQLKLSLDKFNIGGKLSLTLDGPRQLELALKGDHLVLPATETTDTGETDTGETNTDSEAVSDQAVLLTPLLAPLALLEGGKGHIELNLDSITADNIRVEQLHLNLFANDKVLQIADLSGSVFDGTFKATTKIDLKDKTPKVLFTQQLENIDIYNALSTLADQSDIRGSLTMDFSGSTQGDHQETLMANMDGMGKISVNDLMVDNINVEKGYCEMAALVEKRPLSDRAWATHTQLKDLQSDIQWREQKVHLPNLTTGLGNLAVNGNGTVNLAEESYDILINANLQGDRTSETGCPIKSKSIRNRDIPLRCTGSFAEDGGGSCLPDKQFINNLLQDKIKEKLFDKFLKSSSEDEAATANQGTTETADEEPKDVKEQVIDSVLKGLFR